MCKILANNSLSSYIIISYKFIIRERERRKREREKGEGGEEREREQKEKYE